MAETPSQSVASESVDVSASPATNSHNGKPETPVLATSVVGSYSVPEWLERLKTDFYQRRISGQYLDEIHEVAIKAALKDQERAGVDVVSDGELRRDNDIDYFLARMPGVEIPHVAKTFYYDYYDAYVRHPIPVDDESATLGLVDDLRFTLAYTDQPGQVLVHRARSRWRGACTTRRTRSLDDLVLAFARVLNREAKALAAGRRGGPADRRAVPGRLSGGSRPGGQGHQPGVRRASRARRARCTCATATATRGRSGKATTSSCSRPSWTRRSISWCWSSPARATTTWSCSRSIRRQSLTLGLGVIDVKNPSPSRPS